jgi:hypothetical protein
VLPPPPATGCADGTTLVADFVKRAFLAFVVAAALAGPAVAADAPACALLQRGEAEATLGKPVKIDHGGSKNGYSDCAWIRSGKVIGLLYWTPEAFKDGKVTADARFAARAGALSRKDGLASEPEGLAEKARLLDESSPGILAYTVVVQQNGAVAELSARGVTKTEALDLLRSIIGRIPALEPEAEVVEPPPTAPPVPAEPVPAPPQPEPAPPPEPRPVPSEPPAESQPPPTAVPPSEPAPEAPPPAPEPQPEPVPPPVIEPPAPPPAPVPEAVPPQPVPPPEPEPSPPVTEPAVPPPETVPETPPPEPTPIPPPTEPQPPANPPAPAPVKPKGNSPACKLLAKADFKALADAEFTMKDPGAARSGESSCSWRARDTEMFVSLTLMEGEAIPPGQEPAAYFGELETAAADAGGQLVAGVGERAILETSGSGEDAMRSISILAKGRIVFLNLTRIDEDKAIDLARAAAGRM